MAYRTKTVLFFFFFQFECIKLHHFERKKERKSVNPNMKNYIFIFHKFIHRLVKEIEKKNSDKLIYFINFIGISTLRIKDIRDWHES